MARWARLELATDGLEIRCSVLLSYHRKHTDPVFTKRLPAVLSRAKQPCGQSTGYQVTSTKKVSMSGKVAGFLDPSYLLLVT